MNKSKVIELKIPNLGNFKDIPVVDVFITSGAKVEKEEPLIALESDKAVMEVPSEYEGNIIEVIVKQGDTVNEGDIIGKIEAMEISREQIDQKKLPKTAPKKDIIESTNGQTQQKKIKHVNIYEAKTVKKNKPGKYHASPSVRLYARKLGVDLSKIKGSGPKNRIRKEDVHKFVKKQIDTVKLPIQEHTQIDMDEFKKYGDIDFVNLSRIQKISGPRLQQSWQTIPHVTHFDEAEISELEEYRKRLNLLHVNQGIKFTLLPFAIMIIRKALKEYPQFNSTIIPQENKLVLKKYYNIGFAVDTKNGLMVPVLKNADKLGLKEIAHVLQDLSQKAKMSKLSTDDISGATFTISSLGSIGGTGFTPIINPPEVAILGISKAMYKPVWNEQKQEFEKGYILPLSLSYDHRAIDGADAARFCKYLAFLFNDLRNIIL